MARCGVDAAASCLSRGAARICRKVRWSSSSPSWSKDEQRSRDSSFVVVAQPGIKRCSRYLEKKWKGMEQYLSRSTFCQRFGLPQKVSEIRRYAPAIIRSMMPFVLFLIIYGLNHQLHVQPVLTDLQTNVHVSTISRVEQLAFLKQPHDVISAHSHPILDVVAAIPYLLHYSIPLGFPFYLFLMDRVADIPRFYWLLGLSNWTSYIVWWIFPHAPPWVLRSLLQLSDHQRKGDVPPVSPDFFDTVLTTVTPDSLPFLLMHKEGTAFRRLDERFGASFFFNLFVGSPVPYACFPSGHVAWTFVIFLIGGPGGLGFLFYVGWIAWATMYSYHHYLLDVFAGISIVLLTDRWMHLANRLKSRRLATATPTLLPVLELNGCRNVQPARAEHTPSKLPAAVSSPLEVLQLPTPEDNRKAMPPSETSSSSRFVTNPSSLPCEFPGASPDVVLGEESPVEDDFPKRRELRTICQDEEIHSPFSTASCPTTDSSHRFGGSSASYSHLSLPLNTTTSRTLQSSAITTTASSSTEGHGKVPSMESNWSQSTHRMESADDLPVFSLPQVDDTSPTSEELLKENVLTIYCEDQQPLYEFEERDDVLLYVP